MMGGRLRLVYTQVPSDLLASGSIAALGKITKWEQECFRWKVMIEYELAVACSEETASPSHQLTKEYANLSCSESEKTNSSPLADSLPFLRYLNF